MAAAEGVAESVAETEEMAGADRLILLTDTPEKAVTEEILDQDIMEDKFLQYLETIIAMAEMELMTGYMQVVITANQVPCA